MAKQDLLSLPWVRVT